VFRYTTTRSKFDSGEKQESRSRRAAGNLTFVFGIPNLRNLGAHIGDRVLRATRSAPVVVRAGGYRAPLSLSLSLASFPLLSSFITSCLTSRSPRARYPVAISYLSFSFFFSFLFSFLFNSYQPKGKRRCVSRCVFSRGNPRACKQQSGSRGDDDYSDFSTEKESRPRVSIFLSLTTRQTAPVSTFRSGPSDSLPGRGDSTEIPPLARGDGTGSRGERRGRTVPHRGGARESLRVTGGTAFYRLLTHFYPCLVPLAAGPREGSASADEIKRKRKKKKRKEKREERWGNAVHAGIPRLSRMCISSPLDCAARVIYCRFLPPPLALPSLAFSPSTPRPLRYYSFRFSGLAGTDACR
jgi:hypothetical protein